MGALAASGTQGELGREGVAVACSSHARTQTKSQGRGAQHTNRGICDVTCAGVALAPWGAARPTSGSADMVSRGIDRSKPSDLATATRHTGARQTAHEGREAVHTTHVKSRTYVWTRAPHPLR